MKPDAFWRRVSIHPHTSDSSRKPEELPNGTVFRILPANGTGKYLFPSVRTETRPLSDATMLNALRRMGYQKDEMSVHGFRSIASTLLNELGYNRDWIERQLAHGERNEVRAAYNYAEYLPERRRMMQEWADYLDKLRTGKSEQA